MIKRIRQLVHKEVQRRYTEFEESYLSLEKYLYSNLEDRLDTIEAKFDSLSELIKNELQNRKSATEQKLQDIQTDTTEESTAETQETTADYEQTAEIVEVVEKVEEPAVEKIAAKTAEQPKVSISEYPQDNLTQIKGLGATMQTRLYDHGITSFVQLSKLRKKEVEKLGKTIRGFYSRYTTANWKQAAAELAKKKD